MEVTIALLLAAVVIAITYTCFNILYKSYLDFNLRQKRLTDISQFDRVIGRDIEKARVMIQQNNGIIIKTSNSDIKYIFQPDYILRVTGSIDTFTVKAAELATYFQGNELLNSTDDPEDGRLDGISFNIISGNDKFPYYYFKHYSSEDLIDRNNNAIN